MPPIIPVIPIRPIPLPRPPLPPVPAPDRTIHAADTSVAAFAGWTPIGPVNACTPVDSFATFQELYGPLDQRSLVGAAVMHFFLNGGQHAIILRVAAPDGTLLTPSADPANPGPFESALFPNPPGTGIPLLAAVSFNLLCVPGERIPAILTQLEALCEAQRAFFLIDADPAVTDPLSLSAPPIRGANSAFYFPWLLAPDPLNPGHDAAFPPSGAVAGVFARTDAQRGVWHTPAGTAATLLGIAEPAIAITDAQMDLFQPLAINCIRTLPNIGTVVWGARTTLGVQDASSGYTYVPVRRFALFLEQSILQSLAWVVFEPNAQPLWTQISNAVTNFVELLFRQGAFPGPTPAEAYFVRCNSETTTEQDIENGILKLIVGFAPLNPAEFIVLSLQSPAAKPLH